MPVAYHKPLPILIPPIVVEFNVLDDLIFDRRLQKLPCAFLQRLLEKRFLFIFGSLTERDHFKRKPMGTTAELLNKIRALSDSWHGAGTVHYVVLERLAELLEARRPKVSIETGTGRTTLLFSHLSTNHTVFCLDDRGRSNSYGAVLESELLDLRNTKFVLGPTQTTLKNYVFTEPIDLAFLDGPHAYPFLELEYYFIYPHLRAGALLVLDDIHIPTIFRMFEFLKEDKMFALYSVVHNTAIFLRTDEATFHPLGDGWLLQEFNKKRFPVRWRKAYWRWRFRWPSMSANAHRRLPT